MAGAHPNMNAEECTCESCRKFWNRVFVEKRAVSSKSAEGTNWIGQVHKGDRVNICSRSHHIKGDKSFPGVVRYVGLYDEYKRAPRSKVGVSLYDNAYTTHNGIYKGKRYFYCTRGHGAMVSYSDLQPRSSLSPTPPITGNYMFPSYQEMIKTRKLRQKKIEEEEKKLREEHMEKRRSQMQRHGKSTPQQSHDHNGTNHSNEPGPGYQQVHSSRKQDIVERIQVKQLKKMFGDNDNAERMAQTLMKLYQGYEKGKHFLSAQQNEL